jgi:DNA protecting protein DprA
MNKYQPELFNNLSAKQTSFSSLEINDVLVSIMSLNSIKGVGQKTIQAIYDLGIISSIWDLQEAELEEMLAFVGRRKVDLPKIIYKNKSQLLAQGKLAANSLREKGVIFVTDGEKEYPSKLKKIPKPPKWFFACGNTSILSSDGIVGIVGTRKASQEGKIAAYHLAKEFVFQNVIVLSGLAEGIDTQAHQGAVNHYGQTIGILGHGFDAVYTTKNKQLWDEIINRDGVIVTEYLPAESPSRENFLRRNEIQVALSNLIIPIEVPDLASGTGATIRRALSQKTPMLGINIDKRENLTLKQTALNLRNLGVPVFNLPSDQDGFWKFVHDILPNHKWNSGPRERQKRFVKKLFGSLVIIEDFTEELRRASFSEKDLEWLAKEMLERMG